MFGLFSLLARLQFSIRKDRDFAEGDRLQFTVSRPDMDIRNRDLGTVERIDGTDMTVGMDGDKARTLTFDTSEMRHFDHGYAVTSLASTV